MELFKVTKFYRHLYGGGHKKNFRNFAKLYLLSLKTYTFKFGSFTNTKALFPVVPTDIS